MEVYDTLMNKLTLVVSDEILIVNGVQHSIPSLGIIKEFILNILLVMNGDRLSYLNDSNNINNNSTMSHILTNTFDIFVSIETNTSLIFLKSSTSSVVKIAKKYGNFPDYIHGHLLEYDYVGPNWRGMINDVYNITYVAYSITDDSEIRLYSFNVPTDQYHSIVDSVVNRARRYNITLNEVKYNVRVEVVICIKNSITNVDDV